MDPLTFLAVSFFAGIILGGLVLNMAIYVVSQALETFWGVFVAALGSVHNAM